MWRRRVFVKRAPVMSATGALRRRSDVLPPPAAGRRACPALERAHERADGGVAQRGCHIVDGNL